MHGIEYLNHQTHPDTGAVLKGETWNVGYGCRGCEQGRNCWALGQIPRQAKNTPGSRETWAPDGANRITWTGEWLSLPERLQQPLCWRDPRMIAVQFMGDISLAPPEYFAAVMGVIAATPQHMCLMLTKWPDVLRERFEWIAQIGVPLADCFRHLDNHGIAATFPDNPRWPLPNLILGASASTQDLLERRWQDLAQIPARWRVVSLTPKEGLDLSVCRYEIPTPKDFPWARGCYGFKKPNLVIFDGSNGRGAWPTDLSWVRSLRDQCRELGIGFRLKQVGSKPFSVADRISAQGVTLPKGKPNGFYRFLNDPAGGDMSEWPDDLQNCREWLW